jgi:hypothetical protein
MVAHLLNNSSSDCNVYKAEVFWLEMEYEA